MAQADLLSRLEAVTARLEAAAARMGGGTVGDDGVEIPPYVTEFDTLITTHVTPVAAACDKITVGNSGELLTNSFKKVSEYLLKVSQSKKPSPAVLNEFFAPIQEQKKAIESARLKDKRRKFEFERVVLEATMDLCLSFNPLAQGGQAVGLFDSALETINTHTFKQKDKFDVDFFKSTRSLGKAVVEFVKSNFKMGLSFNPKGGDFADAAAGAGATKTAAPAEESKEAPVTTTTTTKKKKAAAGGGGGAGMAGVFGQLNQGLSVTGGLKKVKKEQKTKYRADRSGKVGAKSGKRNGKKIREKTNPVFQGKQGPKYAIENHTDTTVTIEEGALNHRDSVYIYMGDITLYDLSKVKVKSIAIDSCKECQIYVGEVVSVVEMVNCQNTRIIVVKNAPVVQVDKSDSARVILSKEAFVNPPELITSKISAMNLQIPGEPDEIEIPIPEQFVTKINQDGTVNTTEKTHG